MKESPVKGYKLFRFEKIKADGTTTILSKYYITTSITRSLPNLARLSADCDR
jgi:hypothetical protein